MATFAELIKKRENLEFKARCLKIKINELKKTYLPSKGNFEGVRVKNNSSQQEIIILKVEVLEDKLKAIEDELAVIDEQIEEKLDFIANPRDRWIVFRKINGHTWKEISDSECYSVSYVQKVYKDAVSEIEKKEREVF